MNEAKMIIASIWNAKGGVGKTTLATNLASGFTAQGKSVLLIDKDEQLSAYKLNQAGSFAWDCVKDMPKTKPDYDVVIFDHPPSQRTVPDGSVVIVPFAPSKIDFDSFVDSISLLRDKKIISVVNQVDLRNKGEKAFVERVCEQGALMIKRRTLYREAYAANQTVFEYLPKNNRQVLKAAQDEINQLIKEITSHVEK